VSGDDDDGRRSLTEIMRVVHAGVHPLPYVRASETEKENTIIPSRERTRFRRVRVARVSSDEHALAHRER
jgi:hypothetical protein